MAIQLELDLGVLDVDDSLCTSYDPYWDEITCPPTIKVGSRVQMHCPFTENHPFGVVVAIRGIQAQVSWEPYGGSTPINIKYLQLAHQQTSTCKTVGGQVKNHTKNLAHQHNGWVEKYSVIRGGNKYFYWRFAWREGGKKRRRYIGSTSSKKAIATVERVRDAITQGKLPDEIVELLRANKKREIRLGKAAST